MMEQFFSFVKRFSPFFQALPNCAVFFTLPAVSDSKPIAIVSGTGTSSEKRGVNGSRCGEKSKNELRRGLGEVA